MKLGNDNNINNNNSNGDTNNDSNDSNNHDNVNDNNNDNDDNDNTRPYFIIKDQELKKCVLIDMAVPAKRNTSVKASD